MTRLPRHSTLKKAQVFINKLEAARRQLDAAIRMTFANEDELAIHTVAAAAYRILRDLLEKRGRFDLDEIFRAGIYSAASSHARGELPQAELDALKSDVPWLHDLVIASSEKIKTLGDAITPDEIPLIVDRQSRKTDWDRLSSAANFLKHADRDAESHLPLDKLDNDQILVRGVTAYIMAVGQTPDDLRQTPEMSAFQIWWMSWHNPAQLAREYGDKLAGHVRQLSPSKRLSRNAPARA